ncbi:MAG: MarR family transcriptional regulator [Anaerolineaceae bacterium]|nr:MarR family transcriptional regulator [Anaerolineaceae bacterium]
MRKRPDIQVMGKPLATFLIMIHTGRHMMRDLNNEGTFGELTPSQFYTLMALERDEGLPLSEVSEKIHRSPGNMTKVIDNLEKDGLVERQHSKTDRRVVVAVLTDSGREKIHAAKQAHRKAVEAKMQVLDEAELDTLRSILLKLQPDEDEPDDIQP